MLPEHVGRYRYYWRGITCDKITGQISWHDMDNLEEPWFSCHIAVSRDLICLLFERETDDQQQPSPVTGTPDTPDIRKKFTPAKLIKRVGYSQETRNMTITFQRWLGSQMNLRDCVTRHLLISCDLSAQAYLLWQVQSTSSRYATENLSDKQNINFTKVQTLFEEIWAVRMVKEAWFGLGFHHILLILQIHITPLVHHHSKGWALNTLLFWKR